MDQHHGQASKQASKKCDGTWNIQKKGRADSNFNIYPFTRYAYLGLLITEEIIHASILSTNEIHILIHLVIPTGIRILGK